VDVSDDTCAEMLYLRRQMSEERPQYHDIRSELFRRFEDGGIEPPVPELDTERIDRHDAHRANQERRGSAKSCGQRI